jgi:arsenical pump membrane protein
VNEIPVLPSLALSEANGPGESHVVRLTLGAAFVTAAMWAAGWIHTADLWTAADTLWRPVLAILSIMISTAAAQRMGILDVLAARLAPSQGQSPGHVFRSVFILGALTAAILNNDAAVLLLTPLIVGLIGRCYPRRPDLIVPFAFAVFAAAGVAPLATSNPMNLIMAEHTGIGFNEYALRMGPIALAGWLVAYAVMRYLFRRQLSDAGVNVDSVAAQAPSLAPYARSFLVVLILSLACYPVISYFGGPVWVVAAGVAAWGTVLCRQHRVATPGELRAMVAWPIMAFLYCIFAIVLGLLNAGVVDRLAALYALAGDGDARLWLIASVSAVGSALMNNHPIAVMNALVLGDMGDGTHRPVVAALIGGDLGPRLLPMGSLAGLLWFDWLRRLGVRVPVRQFVLVGAAVTVPSLVVSLIVLLLSRG